MTVAPPETHRSRASHDANVKGGRSAPFCFWLILGRSFSRSVNAFADPSFPPPTGSMYESRRHPWLAAPAAIDRHD
jgi:hypothetical protein